MEEHFGLAAEDMMAYFDDDEFLEQPFMQECKREMERDKTLISNPKQIAKMKRAYELIGEITEKEGMDAQIKIEREKLTHTDASIVIYTDALEGSKKRRTVQALQFVLELCDGYLMLPRTDGRIMIDFTFHNIMVEI